MKPGGASCWRLARDGFPRSGDGDGDGHANLRDAGTHEGPLNDKCSTRLTGASMVAARTEPEMEV